MLQQAAPANSTPRASWLKQKFDASQAKPQWVEDEVIVQFRRGTSKLSARAALSARGAHLLRRFEAPGVGPLGVARVPQGADVWSFSRSLRNSAFIREAEPNLIRYPMEIPNDPQFAQLWGINNTGQSHGVSPDPVGTSTGTPDADADVAEAWDTQKGSVDTVVAVLDSGVDVGHPDLMANAWVNTAEQAGAPNVDDDGNGYKDDVNGFDFATGKGSPLVESNTALFGYDHGTHVAGIIAAPSGNATGVAGVCPQCAVMALKFGGPADSDGDGIDDTVGLDLAAELDGLNYAADMGADIVNASFGAPLFYSKIERNVIKAIGNQGVLMVIAAGNSNGDNDMVLTLDFDGDGALDALSPNYPASYNLSNVLAVAASNHRDELAYNTNCSVAFGSPEWPCSFTNWGHESVDVAAPGVDILSTLPSNAYEFFDGTSMASPFVAGVAGLVKSQNPSYTPTQVKNAVLNSVDQPAALDDLFAFPGAPASGDFVLTGGRVNAQKALTASTAGSPVTDGNINGAKAIATSKSGSVRWPDDINDVYKKKLVKGARYKIVLDGPNGGDFDVWVYQPGTTEIHQLESGCLGGGGPCKIVGVLDTPGTADEKGAFKATKAGTYYFQVQSWLFESGSYKLKIVKL
jgi:subtilisin family serine protease